MANIMSLKDIRNNPSQSGFDLSRTVHFTAKCGMLLPVWCRAVYPGDKARIDLSSFSRTMPLNTAAYTSFHEYYDFFFVPMSQLWNQFDTLVTRMVNNPQHSVDASGDFPFDDQLPYFSTQALAQYIFSANAAYRAFPGGFDDNQSNIFGGSRANDTAYLAQLLGYGDYSHYTSTTSSGGSVSVGDFNQNFNLNPWRFLAYQKIYSDYFRFSQWERSDPSTFNLDYLRDSSDLELDISFDSLKGRINMFDMRYCNFPRDMYFGVVPQAQYGDESVVPINLVNPWSINNVGISMSGSSSKVIGLGSDGRMGPANTPTDTSQGSGNFGSGNFSLFSQSAPDGFSQHFSDLSVLALRRAEFLQKAKEIIQAGDEDYKDQIERQFGVKVSDMLSGMCRYLGGFRSDININEVVNNNLIPYDDDSSYAADIAGKGIGSGSGQISFDSNGQYGYIMCIYHCVPEFVYATSSVDRDCTRVNASDWPSPYYDKIGMDSLPSSLMVNKHVSTLGYKPSYLGYVPRYIDIKTDVDVAFGEFRDTLRHWNVVYDDDDFASGMSKVYSQGNNSNNTLYDWSRFKLNPAFPRDILATVPDSERNTDYLLCRCQQKIYFVRKFDDNGLPY